MIKTSEEFTQKINEIFSKSFEEEELDKLFLGYQLAVLDDAIDATSDIDALAKLQLKEDLNSEEKRNAAFERAGEVTKSISAEIKKQIATQALKRLFLSILHNLSADQIEPAKRFEIEDKINALTE